MSSTRQNSCCCFILSQLVGQVTIQDCYEKYFGELVQSVECIVHHHELSEDIVQNLFLEMIQSHAVRKVADYQHLKRYLHLAVRCRAYDWLRSYKKLRTVPLYEIVNECGYATDPVERILLKEKIHAIAAFMTNAKERNRRIFLLHLDGINVRDLSRMFGIAPVTVYAVLSKMRSELKKFVWAEEKMR